MMEVQSEEDSVWGRKHVKYWEGYYDYNESESQGYINIDGVKLL